MWWNRIVAAGMKGVTAANPSDAEPTSRYNTMIPYGFNCVLGAGGMKPADRPGRVFEPTMIRGEGFLVESDQDDRQRTHTITRSLPGDPGV